MSLTFNVHLPLEQLTLRKVRFAVELLDAVSLARVSEGVAVSAAGIVGGPVVNASGLFVWLTSHVGDLKSLVVDPGDLPYEKISRQPSELSVPLTTIELSPTGNYPFTFGTTGLRGRLFESRFFPPQGPVPVKNAAIHLQWLDADDVWHDSPITSHTDENGEFAAVLRLSPSEVPQLDSNEAVSVRLNATRDQGVPRSSDVFKLLQGRVADPPTYEGGPDALTFTWDELQP